MNALTLTQDAPAPALTVLQQIELSPSAALKNDTTLDALCTEIEREIADLPIDLTTEKGRKAIGSLAYKIAQTKTAIDDAGKALTEGWRKQVNDVNARRNTAKDRLQALQDKARKPLTEWEEAEKDRIEACKVVVEDLRLLAIIPHGATSDEIAADLEKARAVAITEEAFAEMFGVATRAKQSAIDALEAALPRAKQAEENARELERLRTEDAERKAKEEAAAAERDRLAAEEKRKADEEERIKNASAIAAKEAEEKAKAELEAKHQAELAEQKRRADELEAKAKEDARVKAETEAEDRRRQEDREHRSKIMGEVKTDLMGIGFTEPAARAAVLAIVKGDIRHTRLEF